MRGANPSPLFASVLIANRGEIAVRIARTLRRLGIRSVLACHRSDATSPAARVVDEATTLPGDDPIAAYLDVGAIVEAARRTGSQAVHPGYGFLSENAEFAEKLWAEGLVFIGPSPEVMRLMGDKIASRAFVAAEGYRVSTSVVEDPAPSTFAERARELGFPLLIKASAGGGGKGLQIVRAERALPDAIAFARSEARRYFGDGRLYAERFVERPRHIEVQVLADRHGACVHLFERECSIQRRFQKLVEECPAPGLDPELRRAIHREAVGIARAANYEGAGTVEFLLSADGEFWFLEMNTRLQVEHPVTELVTGLDLVEQQIRVAMGERLSFSQDEVVASGAAIECRICAEAPDQEFRPATGTLRIVREPSGDGIRFDSGVAEGVAVTASFDPMLAKLVAHGVERSAAIDRMRDALGRTILLGVTNNIDYLARVVDHAAFRNGSLHTGFLAVHAHELLQRADEPLERAAIAAAALSHRGFLDAVRAVPALHAAIGPWRN